MSDGPSLRDQKRAEMRAALGFGRRRFGTARSFKTMNEELRALAPRPGEGQESTPDPFIFKTLQDDAKLPDWALIERQREGGAAFGNVLQDLVEKEDDRDTLLEVHTELSPEGERTIGHHDLYRRIEWLERRGLPLLAVLVLGVALLATAAGLLGGYAALAVGQQ